MRLSASLSADHGHGVGDSFAVLPLKAAHVLVLVRGVRGGCQKSMMLASTLAIKGLLRLVGHRVARLVGLPRVLDVL